MKIEDKQIVRHVCSINLEYKEAELLKEVLERYVSDYGKAYSYEDETELIKEIINGIDSIID